MNSDDKENYCFVLKSKKTISYRTYNDDYSTAEKTIKIKTDECKTQLDLALEKLYQSGCQELFR